MDSFKAKYYASGSSVPDTVEVRITDDGIAVTRTDMPTILLPFDSVSLRLGGHDGRRLVLETVNRDHSLVVDGLSMLDALENHGKAAPLSISVASLRRELRSAPARELKHWAVLIGVVAIGIVLVFKGVDWFVAFASERIPVSVERQLGELVFSRYEKDHEVTSTSAKAQRVQRILDRLSKQVPDCPYEFKAYVESTSDINAMALPGGTVVVFSGLIDRSENDSELAGVLGHEIGHVLARHSLTSLLHQAGLFGCVKIVFGDIGADQAAWLSRFLNLEKLQFDRNQEDQADNTGVRLAYSSDYDPRGLIRFFERLQKEESNPQLSKALEIMSSHPFTPDRIKRVKETIARLEAAKKRADG